MGASEILQGMRDLVGRSTDTNLLFMYRGLELIKEYSSLFLGILATLIIVMMPIIIGLEVVYLNFPTAQAGIQYLSGKYKDKVVAKTLTLMFRDANRAILESSKNKYGQSINLIYFKIKLKTVFLTAIVLAILLGPIDIIIDWFIRIITNVVSRIS